MNTELSPSSGDLIEPETHPTPSPEAAASGVSPNPVLPVSASVSGTSSLQQLKELPDEEHDFLLERRGGMTLNELVWEIDSLYGIQGLTQPRLTEFFVWLSERRALEKMKRDQAAFLENFGESNGGKTYQEAHEAMISSLHLKAIREGDEKLMRFVLGEIRKVRTLNQGAEKLRLMERRVAVLEQRFDADHPRIKDQDELTPQEKADVEEWLISKGWLPSGNDLKPASNSNDASKSGEISGISELSGNIG